MKILQTMAGGLVGGAEEFFVQCAKAFEEQGIIQRALIRKNGSRTERIRSAGIETISLPFGGFFDRRTVPRIAMEIDEFRPDILISWMKRATSMSIRASKLAKHKFVKVGRLDGYYNLKYFKGCDHLVAVTPDLVDFAVNQGWQVDRVHFVPNFPINEPGKSIPRGLLGIPDNAPLVLAVGRLHPNKGFDILLRALKPLDGVFLLLAGEGDERSRLRKLTQDLGITSRVRFLGWREDISDLMMSADVFVCSSRVEAFGIIIVEAWASRLPIAACTANGPAWLIKDEVDGLLTPVDDTEALSKSILRLIEDPELRKRLAISGYRRYEAEFTKSAFVERSLDLFSNFVDRSC